ncbi:putative Ig domain-containing protein [Kitasatospora aureofaciens]|uniref:putative Ig domain-containing protein n=1 Tax=Kitasatospora aureofaciens TaxID=1894 RepID=UPI001C492CAC|nr:trypsin-like peptidase domain-containing protein [Kitasatospora aureofaciens]
MFRRLVAVAGAGAVVAGGLTLAAAPAHAVQASDLTATIALSNCSASLVRYPTSVDGDRALMLTNGHCLPTMPNAGEVIQNVAAGRSGTLLDGAGNSLGTVQADQVLYATMTGTDVALYRLTDTYGSISSRYGVTALTINDGHPTDGAAMYIPSSYWKQVWNCSVNGFVPTLREDQWTWHDSLRYSAGCNTTHGTSGSPIVDSASGRIVGINNTGNDDGQMCTLNNPCEVAADGTTTATKGQSYGEETYWFTTCLGNGRVIDLNVSGCLLTKPAGSGAVSVSSPGDQSTPAGGSVNLQIQASGGTAPLSYAATGLPAGLSINSSTGLISGSASAVGTYPVTVTVTDAAGRTATVSFNWAVQGAGGSCTPAQLLGNPGFETGSAAPWTASSGVIDNSASQAAHSGSWKAWLDGYGSAHTDTLSQTVTIPAGCKATLSFWLHVDTAETGTTPYDKLTVSVNGTTLKTYSNVDAAAGYQQRTFDLSAYAGQSVTLKFTGTEDASLQTSFVIDDTSIQTG